MDDDVKTKSAVTDAPDEAVADDSSSTSENTEPEKELADDLADFADSLEDDGQTDEDDSEDAQNDDDNQNSAAEDTPGKDARIEKLIQEITELKSQIGIAPNADVRLAVKERNLLRELADNDIKGQALTLEQKLLGEVNPETGDNYSPAEAATLARNAEIAAQAENLERQQYTLGVERNQGVISREIETAMRDFPIFAETLPNGQPNPAYDQQAAELAGQHLLDAYITDAEGKVVEGIKRSPYEIFKSVANSFETTRKTAEGKAADNLSRQSASADVRTSGSTSVSRKDPEMAEFDEHFGL